MGRTNFRESPNVVWDIARAARISGRRTRGVRINRFWSFGTLGLLLVVLGVLVADELHVRPDVAPAADCAARCR